MALDTYDDLVKQVINWSHRDDLSVLVPDFIQLAENAMYSNEVAPLKVRSMETIITNLTTAQYIDLPEGFESARSIRLLIDDGGGEIHYQAPEQMHKIVGTGRPLYFTIIGDQVQFNRPPDSEYTIEFQFYKKADALTELNQTNEILLQHPSIYLFGALSALFAYTQDAQQEISNQTKFITAIKGANKADKNGRYGPAPTMSLTNGMIV